MESQESESPTLLDSSVETEELVSSSSLSQSGGMDMQEKKQFS